MTQIKTRKFSSFIIGALIVPSVFHVMRFVKDQTFLARLDNASLKPGLLGRAVTFLARVWNYVSRIFRWEFDEYALRRYSRYIQFHYGEQGRGYFSYADLDDAQKAALFGTPGGRIARFIDRFPGELNYNDSDSFFDAGCGRGQNVKVLMERFPASPIHAVDFSPEAVSVITLAVRDEKVTAVPGDLTDPATFAGISDRAYDHVVMSHVLSVILGDGVKSTKSMRRMIVEQLTRIARKSVLIIDSPAIVARTERFEIEQRDRGYFQEDITQYLPDAMSAPIILDGGESVAVLVRVANAASGRK